VKTHDDWNRKGFCEQFEFMWKAVEDGEEQKGVCRLFPVDSTLFFRLFRYMFLDCFNELNSEVDGLL